MAAFELGCSLFFSAGCLLKARGLPKDGHLRLSEHPHRCVLVFLYPSLISKGISLPIYVKHISIDGHEYGIHIYDPHLSNSEFLSTYRAFFAVQNYQDSSFAVMKTAAPHDLPNLHARKINFISNSRN
jgi:hypothetical protein